MTGEYIKTNILQINMHEAMLSCGANHVSNISKYVLTFKTSMFPDLVAPIRHCI